MITAGASASAPDVVRLRMAGRENATAFVVDLAPPPIVRHHGWWSHAVHFVAGSDASRDVVVPAEPALTRAAPRRLAAYLAGRYCASRALHAAGCDGDVRVPIGDAGAPAWHAGVVGSISHAAACAVAVVAPTSRWRGVGVDCERVLDAGEVDEVVRSALPEVDAVDVTGDGAISWEEFVTVGFSAKESLYKCLRPLVGEFFGFEDAALTHLDRTAHTVRLCLTRGLGRNGEAAFGMGATFDVRFAVDDGHAYTVLGLPRSGRGGLGGCLA